MFLNGASLNQGGSQSNFLNRVMLKKNFVCKIIHFLLNLKEVDQQHICSSGSLLGFSVENQKPTPTTTFNLEQKLMFA